MYKNHNDNNSSKFNSEKFLSTVLNIIIIIEETVQRTVVYLLRKN